VLALFSSICAAAAASHVRLGGYKFTHARIECIKSPTFAILALPTMRA